MYHPLSFSVTVALVLLLLLLIFSIRRHSHHCIIARVRQIATEANRVKVDYDAKYAEKLKKMADAYVFLLFMSRGFYSLIYFTLHDI